MQYKFDHKKNQRSYDRASFCCDTRPEISLSINVRSSSGQGLERDTHAFFCYRADDNGSLHITLVVYDDAGVVLKMIPI
jgi:hypothetical protein